jgi:hypothetical protein
MLIIYLSQTFELFCLVQTIIFSFCTLDCLLYCFGVVWCVIMLPLFFYVNWIALTILTIYSERSYFLKSFFTLTNVSDLIVSHPCQCVVFYLLLDELFYVFRMLFCNWSHGCCVSTLVMNNSTLCRVFTILYLKQTVFLKYVVLQLFYSNTLWYL